MDWDDGLQANVLDPDRKNQLGTGEESPASDLHGGGAGLTWQCQAVAPSGQFQLLGDGALLRQPHKVHGWEE